MTFDPSALLGMWWTHVAAASVEFACLALAVALLDTLLARFAAPETRAALWWAVLAKLLLPIVLPGALAWSVPDAIVPAALSHSVADVGTGEMTSNWRVSATFAVWLAGVMLFVAVGISRYRKLRRRRWNASEPAPLFVNAVARTVARKLGLSQPSPVRIFRGAGGPVVLGYFRPTVLIPHTLLPTDHREELELVLFHELAHVKRRDPLWSLLGLTIQVFHWFHPLVWIARRRLTVLRELACDQTVGRALGGDTASYRRTLLTLAQTRATPAPGGVLAFLTPRSQLAARIRLLERPITGNGMRRRAQAAALFVVLFTCGLPKAPPLSVPYPYEIPPLEDLAGCLPRRYAVLSMVSHAKNVAGSELAPVLARSTISSIKEKEEQ